VVALDLERARPSRAKVFRRLGECAVQLKEPDAARNYYIQAKEIYTNGPTQG
jgi:hypothetical protein